MSANNYYEVINTKDIYVTVVCAKRYNLRITLEPK